MSKMILRFFGYFNSCADRSGIEYPASDWRADYCRRPSLVSIYASEHKAPGKLFAFFFPYEPTNPHQNWIRSSAGDLTVDENVYTMTTKDSIYTFLRDDAAIPDSPMPAYGID